MSQKEELTREEYLAHEDEFLRSLLEAAEDIKTETTTIEIARKGKTLFSFRIRPLSEEDFNKCSEQATKYEFNRRLGIRIPSETNRARLRSLLIYTATVEEDRKRLWDNKTAWEKLNVLSGPDLIDKVLLPGEKEKVVEKIEEISGYGEEALDKEELAKN